MFAKERFGPMGPDESIALAFDFVRDIDVEDRLGRGDGGEVVSSAVFTLEVFEGTDSSASSWLTGSATVYDDTKAAQRVGPGLVDGVTYRLRCLATTNRANLIALHSFIACKAPLGVDT